MQAGKLWQDLLLQTNTPTTAQSGQAVASWSTTSNPRGQIEALSGDDLARARQVAAEVTHKVTLRYRGSVTARQRLVSVTGRVYYILWIDDDGRRKGLLVCYCAVRE